MNKSITDKLLQNELKKRKAPLPNILGECFPQQLQFVNDPSKRKILCLTRRSGKSTAVGLYMINEALKNPRSKSVYVNLTKEIAKKVMWTDIFEAIFLKLNIPAELVGNDIKFKNGSTIFLTGADANYKEKQKLRGQKNRLAVVDECQSFTQDLEELVLSVIMPTLADYNGILCMIGTPGDQMGGHYWWKLNNPDNKDINKSWTYFHWGWKDNPHVRDNVQAQIDEWITANPLIVNTTKFRQEYLGEWVINEDMRTYKSASQNYITDLSPLFFRSAKYILSVDLGYEDATAFVICAYNPVFDNRMYVLESYKESHLITDQVVNKINEYARKYALQSIICDSSAKQLVETMRQKYSLPLWSAERASKKAHISVINSDFVTKNVMILKQHNEDLINELETQIWDPVKFAATGKKEEKAGMDNHLADALLYGHHASRHYWFQPVQEVKPNTNDYFTNIMLKKHMEKLNQQRNDMNLSLEVNYDE